MTLITRTVGDPARGLFSYGAIMNLLKASHTMEEIIRSLNRRYLDLALLFEAIDDELQDAANKRVWG